MASKDEEGTTSIVLDGVGGIIFLISVVGIIILTAGNPDLLDAIINRVNCTP
jgi:hypothetical protein